METLGEYHAEIRNTTRLVEVKKILQLKITRNTTAKYKWYLVKRHGMIS